MCEDEWRHVSPHLVTKGVAFIPFQPSWDAHPQAPQPETDGAAETETTLDVPLTGLQDRARDEGVEDRQKPVKELLCFIYAHRDTLLCLHLFHFYFVIVISC